MYNKKIDRREKMGAATSLNTLNWQQIIFSFLGGLGMFLFCIKYMGDGLQLAAGDRLKYILDKYLKMKIN